jgi:hypothetical protein
MYAIAYRAYRLILRTVWVDKAIAAQQPHGVIETGSVPSHALKPVAVPAASKKLIPYVLSIEVSPQLQQHSCGIVSPLELV